MINHRFVSGLKKSLLLFLILTLFNSNLYGEGKEESVSTFIFDKARDIIEIHFIQKLSETPALSSDFTVKWKNFQKGSYSEKNLSINHTSSNYDKKDNILFLKLSKPAPLTGLIILKYNANNGKLKRSDGEKVKNFTSIVENRAGIIAYWRNTSERYWLGRNFWGNRLQDWRLRGSRLECLQAGPGKQVRTVHLITREVIDKKGDIHISVRTGVLETNDPQGWSGFLIGAGKSKLDYKAASLIHQYSGNGGGLLCVMNMNGNLQFRNNNDENTRDVYPVISPDLSETPNPQKRNMWEDIQLDLDIVPSNFNRYNITLSAWNYITGEFLGGITLNDRDETEIKGNIALVSSPMSNSSRGPRFWFSNFRIDGEKIKVHQERGIGPVIGTLYTVSNHTLKLTAQFMPIGLSDSRTAKIEYRKSYSDLWIEGAEMEIILPGYTAHFRIENWDDSSDYQFRIIYKNKNTGYPPYNGIIKKDPKDKEEIVVAGFTGMMVIGRPPDDSWGRYGYGQPERWTTENVWFPHKNIISNIPKHNTDLLFFTGDQVYESGNPTVREDDGRFPELDYLYRWYFWCWSFGELTRNIPAICQTDDHDVYQGNIWGWSGRRNLTGNNNDGGYMYEPEFVNMVQRTQCWSNPDPFDPTPILQRITVYYTCFNYGGVSFSVLEDRKFKTPPFIINTKSRDLIWDGKIQDKNYDMQTLDVPEAELLGERQLYFLKKWSEDWRGAKMKVCVTQTIFSAVQTNPDGNMVPDMDSNGWPQTGRNKAVDLLRRAHAFVIGGDQHLAFLVKHGIKDFGDGVYQFCVPAVANKYRRWFDPKTPGKNRKIGAPYYTGDFFDAFGNKITVLAVANSNVKQKDVLTSNIERFGPRRDGHSVTGRKYNCDGYGIVRINKKEQTFTIECWPWDANIEKGDSEQFPGWPAKISLEECDGRKPSFYLPDIHISGLSDPVVQIIDESNNEVVYTTRAKNGYFRPGVFKEGRYIISVGEPGTSAGMKTFQNIKTSPKPGSEKIEVIF